MGGCRGEGGRGGGGHVGQIMVRHRPGKRQKCGMIIELSHNEGRTVLISKHSGVVFR